MLKNLAKISVPFLGPTMGGKKLKTYKPLKLFATRRTLFGLTISASKVYWGSGVQTFYLVVLPLFCSNSSTTP
jgi:hypothetical protein